MDGADARYLESKRTVDARARSPRVRERLLEALAGSPSVLDVGAGTGAALRDLLDWGVDVGAYRGIDRSAELVEHAREALPAALSGAHDVERTGEGLRVDGAPVTFEVGEVEALGAGEADLVVAQALLDLVPPVSAMDAVERALRPGGLAYLPITFDGVSLFVPAHPDDEAVLGAYHAAIDRRPGRDSRAGRRLLGHLPDRAGELLAVAASDWIVRPHGGGYPASEAHFLGCVLDFVEEALAGGDVDAAGWISDRRAQLEAAELTYVAHGYDFLYRAPP